MQSVNRREFLMNSFSAAAVAAVLPQRQSRAANDKVTIGLMGCGGRGTQVAQLFAGRSDAQIVYLCDPDNRRSARAKQTIEKTQNKPTQVVQDFRRILDDKSVDALINATPDHWHALGTIMACQAGKDVYTEKPMCHNIWEGRKMIEAARKYNRVVQVGTQSRSIPYAKDALEQIRNGKLGDVHLVRVFNMMEHPMRKAGSVQPVPEGFDYDLWCGPAPKPPYNPSRYWLNEWDYSCGPIAGDAIHQLDLARMVLGDRPYPKTVAHAGGVHALKDGREVPDTQLALFEYGDDFTLVFESALWTPYLKKVPTPIRELDVFPDWPFYSMRIEILGTKGFMYLGRHGGGWQIFDTDAKVVDFRHGPQGDKWHQDNFIDCIRSRQKPVADVEQGHYSALLCHLANISYRVGNQKLTFDPKTETFVNHPEANKYLKREYRQPWVVPEQV
ncbi:MAG: Gfo/Idh/MocA family oxidoreductase [Planctomycetes bacterium]|nr:Gfo/Idh/MocA family oxidoreductase [Planctomycetota bacterium]